jgi:phage baseplate assembly protein W
MPTQYININYPFRNSTQGFFLDLTSNDNDAIQADFLFLVTTQVGTRFYNPQFGTNLLQYIFEPNDNLTLGDIKTEITTALAKYLPAVQLTNLTVVPSTTSEFAAQVTIAYTVNDGVFSTPNSVTINI